jgi:hypothetical protein
MGSDSPTSGHSGAAYDPRMLELYPNPANDDPDHIKSVVTLHARQLELGVITAKEQYRQIRALNGNLAKTNSLLETQIKLSEVKTADERVEVAKKERATKLQTAGMSLLAAVVGGLLAFAGSYYGEPDNPPDPPVLSAEQRRQIVIEENSKRSARGDQPVSPEYERQLLNK